MTRPDQLPDYLPDYLTEENTAMPLPMPVSRARTTTITNITTTPPALRRDRRRDRVRRVRAARLGGRAICDCSAPKLPVEEACAQCRWRDGVGGGPSTIIAELRTAGGCATRAALELATGLSGRHILRIISDLLAAGRVVRELHAEPHVAGRVRGRPVYLAHFRLSDRRRRDRRQEVSHG